MFEWAMAIGFAALLGGCATFDGAYKAAVETGWPADSIEGAWEGKWESKGGHGGGDLKAVVTRGAEDIYFVHFRASYWGMFQTDQEVNFRTTSTDPIKATGTADLGYLKGGVYRYEATITPQRFEATYVAEADRGEFNLARPTKK